jgi:hypothetical protein
MRLTPVTQSSCCKDVCVVAEGRHTHPVLAVAPEGDGRSGVRNRSGCICGCIRPRSVRPGSGHACAYHLPVPLGWSSLIAGSTTLKASVPRGTGGSNPSASAILTSQNADFQVYRLVAATCGVPGSRPTMVSSGFTLPFVLVDQPTQNWSTLDPFMVEIRGGVGPCRRRVKTGSGSGPLSVIELALCGVSPQAS